MRSIALVGSFTVLSVLLGGCGLVQVKGPTSGSAPTTTSATESPASPAAASAPSAAEPAQEATKSRAVEDAERNIQSVRSQAAETERTKLAYVSAAIAGFSSADLRSRIASFFKEPEKPSPELLASADAAYADYRALVAKIAVGQKPEKRVASDAASEKGIRESFATQHAGAQIKAAYLVDKDWRLNYKGLVVSGRYKKGVVVIAIEGVAACLEVPATIGSAASGPGTFASKPEYGSYVKGTVVECE